MKDKIIKHFKSAELTNLIAGKEWYEKAHIECQMISDVFSIPLTKVVGVMASLSPNNKWQQNIKDTWKFLEKPHLNTKVCTFKSQRRKSLLILESDGTDISIKRILNGPKTKNFYDNILHYNSSNLVTIDVWAYRSLDLVPSKKNFELAEKAYVEASYELNLRPHQVQAVVWGVVRGDTA
jgi:hypothetical protein